jgi:hypothetical protein
MVFGDRTFRVELHCRLLTDRVNSDSCFEWSLLARSAGSLLRGNLVAFGVKQKSTTEPNL